MAQSTVLAAGTTETTSSDITVAAGSTVVVGLFSASKIPEDIFFSLMMDTPSADIKIGDLSDEKPVLMISGPGTYRVKRPALTGGISVGVFLET